MNFQNQLDYLRQFHNEDILEGVTVPAPLQLETLKSQIMFRCGLLEPVYLEPQIMQTAIAQFFKREQWNITHLVNIILAEYSPIENTDRYTERKSTQGGTRNVTSNSNGKDVNSGLDQTDTRHTGTDKTDYSWIREDTTTNTVSAYNSSGYQPDNKSLEEEAKKGSESVTYGHQVNNAVIHGHTINREDSKTTNEQTSGSDNIQEHTHGNIGTTSNQELIQQELELLRHFDIYDWIAAKLENELFVQVY